MFHAPRPNENLAIGRLEYVEVRRFFPPTRKALLYLAGLTQFPQCFLILTHYAKHVLKYVKYLSLKEIGCTVAKCCGRLGLSAHQSQLVINAHSFFSIVFQPSGRGSSRSAVKCHVT